MKSKSSKGGPGKPPARPQDLLDELMQDGPAVRLNRLYEAAADAAREAKMALNEANEDLEDLQSHLHAVHARVKTEGWTAATIALAEWKPDDRILRGLLRISGYDRFGCKAAAEKS